MHKLAMFLCNAQHPHKRRRHSLPMCLKKKVICSTNTTLYYIAFSNLAFFQAALVVRW
jgi:hypothetical protein